jgi:hypothetical protein
MATFHLSVKVISRSSGRRAVAATAYRGAERLHDVRLDRDHDFTNKAGVVHSEVLLPEGAPEEFADRKKSRMRSRPQGSARTRSFPGRSSSPFRAS